MVVYSANVSGPSITSQIR